MDRVYASILAAGQADQTAAAGTVPCRIWECSESSERAAA
jgi:hypothetical protein